jgi:hypothetical protein
VQDRADVSIECSCVRPAPAGRGNTGLAPAPAQRCAPVAQAAADMAGSRQHTWPGQRCNHIHPHAGGAGRSCHMASSRQRTCLGQRCNHIRPHAGGHCIPNRPRNPYAHHQHAAGPIVTVGHPATSEGSTSQGKICYVHQTHPPAPATYHGQLTPGPAIQVHTCLTTLPAPAHAAAQASASNVATLFLVPSTHSSTHSICLPTAPCATRHPHTAACAI